MTGPLDAPFVDGPVNVRDVGGLPLAGGGRTHSGVLLRGDALYHGDVAPNHVVWPPSTVIDLRSGSERARSPYQWPDGTTVIHRQLYDAADLAVMPAHSSLLGVYRDMVDRAGAGIAGLLDLMGSDGATYLHCAAGKDRTGVSIAALLLLAGVPEEAVVADYRATAENIDGVLGRLIARGVLPDDWDVSWAETPLDAIGLMVEAVAEHRGGPRGWFAAHGASDATIDRYLQRIQQLE